VGEENFYLERFLKLSGWVSLTFKPRWEEGVLINGQGDKGDGYDLVLLYHASPAAPLAGRFLLIDTPFPPWVEGGGEIEAEGLSVEVREDLPLVAGLNPEDWRFLKLRKAEADPQGRVILSAGGVPLLYLYETPGLRLAYLGVDLDASNLGLSLDFPILMYRLLSWLAPRMEEETQLEIGAELPLDRFERPISITGPQGKVCEYPSEDALCGLVDRPGFYEVRHGELSAVFAANPPPGESLLAPPSNGQETRIPATEGTARLKGGELRAARPLWPYLLGVGILLLALELVYFDRSLLPLRPVRRPMR